MIEVVIAIFQRRRDIPHVQWVFSGGHVDYIQGQLAGYLVIVCCGAERVSSSDRASKSS